MSSNFSIGSFGTGTVRAVAGLIFLLAGLMLGGKIFFGTTAAVDQALPAPAANTTLAAMWDSFAGAIQSAFNMANPLLIAGVGVVGIVLVLFLIRVLT